MFACVLVLFAFNCSSSLCTFEYIYFSLVIAASSVVVVAAAFFIFLSYPFLLSFPVLLAVVVAVAVVVVLVDWASKTSSFLLLLLHNGSFKSRK